VPIHVGITRQNPRGHHTTGLSGGRLKKTSRLGPFKDLLPATVPTLDALTLDALTLAHYLLSARACARREGMRVLTR